MALATGPLEEPDLQAHGLFLKRNAAFLADLASLGWDRTVVRLSLLEELTILVATERPATLLDGRLRRRFLELFGAHAPRFRATWSVDQWRRQLPCSPGVLEGAPQRLHRMHRKLGRRHDYPYLGSMRKGGDPRWKSFFQGLGMERSYATVVSALILDRRKLAAAPWMKPMYARLGFLMDGRSGEPRRLSAYREDLPKLKWALARLALTTCTPSTVAGSSTCGSCPVSAFCLANRLATQSHPTKQPGFVDFFAGGGGLSLGLSNAGLSLKAAVEIDVHAADTLYLNHPEAKSADIFRKDVRRLIRDRGFLARYHGVDVMAGGPPCQPFSMARRHSGADVHDSRRHLFSAFLKTASLLQPRILLMENVPGIKSAGRGRTLRRVLRGFRRIGFSVRHIELNASEHGVPQNRNRIFFIGLNAKRYSTPEKILDEVIKRLAGMKSKKAFNVGDALSGLPHVLAGEGAEVLRSPRGRRSKYAHRMKSGRRVVFNHVTRPHNARDLEIFRLMKPGETARQYEARFPGSIPYQLESFGDKYRKLHAARPAPTIPSHLKRDANSFVHPTIPRGITPREAARFQSFPDGYVFLGGFGPAFVQIGNAVPPRLAEAVGRAILPALVAET